VADNVFCQWTATCVSETVRLKKCILKVFIPIFNKKSHYRQFLRELFRPSYRYDYQRNYTDSRKTFIQITSYVVLTSKHDKNVICFFWNNYSNNYSNWNLLSYFDES